MIANYMIIDDISLFELERLDTDAFFNKIEDFQNMEEDFPICDIDKIWNGLYFILTGKPEPNDLEPEDFAEYSKNIFVFGEEYFDNDEFISCIRNKT
ncbi:MAG: YfbM family protein, partial [Eubacteriales bacterium]|nr:YfbM family protein [Eubacteriales bacterium]